MIPNGKKARGAQDAMKSPADALQMGLRKRGGFKR